MQVTKANTETIVKNMRAEGQGGSRADYIELMQRELDNVFWLCAEIAKSNIVDVPRDQFAEGHNAACRIIAYQIKQRAYL